MGASAKPEADAVYAATAKDGFVEHVTDASAAQGGPCFWSDF